MVKTSPKNSMRYHKNIFTMSIQGKDTSNKITENKFEQIIPTTFSNLMEDSHIQKPQGTPTWNFKGIQKIYC